MEYTAKRPHASYFKDISTQTAKISFNNILTGPHLDILRHRRSKKLRDNKLNSISAHINKKLETERTVKTLWGGETDTTVIGINMRPEEMQLLKFQILQRKLV